MSFICELNSDAEKHWSEAEIAKLKELLEPEELDQD